MIVEAWKQREYLANMIKARYFTQSNGRNLIVLCWKPYPPTATPTPTPKRTRGKQVKIEVVENEDEDEGDIKPKIEDDVNTNIKGKAKAKGKGKGKGGKRAHSFVGNSPPIKRSTRRNPIQENADKVKTEVKTEDDDELSEMEDLFNDPIIDEVNEDEDEIEEVDYTV
jgi:hypothetical protein